MIGKFMFSGALLLVSLLVQAEEMNDTSKVYDLDEIVVVSQPKDGRLLRHQALSSTVLTQNEMQMLGVKDLSRLSEYVPSFSMPQYGSRLTSSMYIRGIGSRINNPAVGIYYDNIPLMSKSAFNHHFYQVDRIDVLRGPQGTLYGMNTEGGLVHIYSKNPMAYQGTDISMGIGTGLATHAEIAHFHRPNSCCSHAGNYICFPDYRQETGYRLPSSEFY
jgi:outer membrane cobalamin receptor